MFTVERLILQIKIVFCDIFLGYPLATEERHSRKIKRTTKESIPLHQVRLSSKFLKTDTYRDCEEAREIVPQMTMGPVVSCIHD